MERDESILVPQSYKLKPALSGLFCFQERVRELFPSLFSFYLLWFLCIVSPALSVADDMQNKNIALLFYNMDEVIEANCGYLYKKMLHFCFCCCI